MRNIFFSITALLIITSCSGGLKHGTSCNDCGCDKDSMVVVMRFERKIKPDQIAFLKQSFDACKTEVIAKEPGCLDYSLFQSYNDSTLFCLTETWINKGAHNAHMLLEHTKKHIAETSGIDDPSFKSTSNYIYWICPGANQKE